MVTAPAPGTRSTPRGGPCVPATSCSLTRGWTCRRPRSPTSTSRSRPPGVDQRPINRAVRPSQYRPNRLNPRRVARLVGLLARQPRQPTTAGQAPWGRPRRSPGSCAICRAPGQDLRAVSWWHILRDRGTPWTAVGQRLFAHYGRPTSPTWRLCLRPLGGGGSGRNRFWGDARSELHEGFLDGRPGGCDGASLPATPVIGGRKSRHKVSMINDQIQVT